MIENAFFTRIEASGFLLPIAYQGMDFTPPDAGMWLEVRVLRNAGIDVGLADDSSKIEQGIFQITVNVRPNTGIIALTQKAQDIINTFPRGTKIDNVKLNRTPYMMSLITLDDRIMLPISMPYSQ